MSHRRIKEPLNRYQSAFCLYSRSIEDPLNAENIWNIEYCTPLCEPSERPVWACLSLLDLSEYVFSTHDIMIRTLYPILLISFAPLDVNCRPPGAWPLFCTVGSTLLHLINHYEMHSKKSHCFGTLAKHSSKFVRETGLRIRMNMVDYMKGFTFDISASADWKPHSSFVRFGTFFLCIWKGARVSISE